MRVGNRVETGFHLLQLWTRYQERAEEVLVLYPADGYWRARPLPPQNLRWSAYGSSFLIGPVETGGRPFVDISDVAFDPATRTFTLNFARGGSATLRLDKLDQERIVLDVALTQPVAAERPFAALRSMFVSEGNADVAQVGWRGKGSADLAAGAGDEFQARQRRRTVGRAARAVAPQHQRARHGVPRFQRRRLR